MMTETAKTEFRAWAMKTYMEKSAAHDYILGFQFKGSVYMAEVNAETFTEVITVDRASRGAGLLLRFKPTTAHKVFLLKYAKVLCSADLFTAEVENSKYNAGETFEKMVTEFFGQEWTKDNVPFTKAGDINVNGKEIQIKYERASLANERQLLALR